LDLSLCSNLSLVAEWVGDSPYSPTVLGAHRSDFGGTSPHGLIEHDVGVVDDKQRPTRGAAYRSGAEAPHVRTRLGHPELGGPDHQLSRDIVPVANAVKHDGVERSLVEGDCSARSARQRRPRQGRFVQADVAKQHHPLRPRQPGFTSWAFTENVRRLGLVSSMGTVGDCYDDAPMESFWGSMQVELLDRQRWRTILELAVAIADWVDHFYNSARRHSALGYLTPNEFEALHSPQPQATLS
jgi:hypothetical protein